MELLNEVTFWHWMILGVVLIIAEALVPGAVLLWMGVAAIATGLVELLLPNLGWQIQCLVFALFSIVSVYFGRAWMKKRADQNDHPTLNKRGADYIGRRFVLADPVVNGIGSLRVDDTSWKLVAEEDFPAGTKVVVTGMQGMSLIVASAEAPEAATPGEAAGD